MVEILVVVALGICAAAAIDLMLRPVDGKRERDAALEVGQDMGLYSLDSEGNVVYPPEDNERNRT